MISSKPVICSTTANSPKEASNILGSNPQGGDHGNLFVNHVNSKRINVWKGKNYFLFKGYLGNIGDFKCIDLVHTDTLSPCFSHKSERGDEAGRHSKTMQSSTHTDLGRKTMIGNQRKHPEECALDKYLGQ